jgi:hypothetical protein
VTSARWQSLSDWPLIGAAVLFLVTYSWQVLGDLHGADEPSSLSANGRSQLPPQFDPGQDLERRGIV